MVLKFFQFTYRLWFRTVLLCVIGLVGCSPSPTPQTTTYTQSPENAAPLSRRTPVVAGRPARMFIWAGLDPDDCSAIEPKLEIAKPPSKGVVTFRPNQMTKVMQSTSGKCIGHQVYGTGIYYTARQGQTGRDQFAITARTPGDPPVTRSFTLTIVE